MPDFKSKSKNFPWVQFNSRWDYYNPKHLCVNRNDWSNLIKHKYAQCVKAVKGEEVTTRKHRTFIYSFAGEVVDYMVADPKPEPMPMPDISVSDLQGIIEYSHIRDKKREDWLHKLECEKRYFNDASRIFPRKLSKEEHRQMGEISWQLYLDDLEIENKKKQLKLDFNKIEGTFLRPYYGPKVQFGKFKYFLPPVNTKNFNDEIFLDSNLFEIPKKENTAKYTISEPEYDIGVDALLQATPVLGVDCIERLYEDPDVLDTDDLPDVVDAIQNAKESVEDKVILCKYQPSSLGLTPTRRRKKALEEEMIEMELNINCLSPSPFKEVVRHFTSEPVFDEYMYNLSGPNTEKAYNSYCTSFLELEKDLKNFGIIVSQGETNIEEVGANSGVGYDVEEMCKFIGQKIENKERSIVPLMGELTLKREKLLKAKQELNDKWGGELDSVHSQMPKFNHQEVHEGGEFGRPKYRAKVTKVKNRIRRSKENTKRANCYKLYSDAAGAIFETRLKIAQLKYLYNKLPKRFEVCKITKEDIAVRMYLMYARAK
jgi:hypothetical protein